MTAPHFQIDPLLASTTHGFFGRQGGVSDGLYSSLNIGLGSNDEIEKIIINRRRVASCLNAQNLVTGYQTHSNKVAEVFAPDDKPDADALFTKEKGIALGVLSADCVPVLICGSIGGDKTDIVATAHAGWKGAAAGIIENLVAKLKTEQAQPDSLKAVIGPAISQKAYQVGRDVFNQVVAVDPSAKNLFLPVKESDKFLFNLPAFVQSRIKAAGIKHVSNLDICTYLNPDEYFSYRRTTHQKESDYGRQVSAITLT